MAEIELRRRSIWPSNLTPSGPPSLRYGIQTLALSDLPFYAASPPTHEKTALRRFVFLVEAASTILCDVSFTVFNFLL